MIELALALQLVTQCAPNVAPETMAAIVRVESSNNPYAIGVVGGALPRQPRSKAEALAAVAELERQGKNFSMGLAQINRHNLPRYGITYSQVFDSCTNLRVGGQILEDCYRRAMPRHEGPQAALRAALSCYYSGNFVRGFRPDRAGDPSYVEKVVAAAGQGSPQMVVPAIQSIAGQPTPEPYIESSVLVPMEGEAQTSPAVVNAPPADEAQPVRLRAVAVEDEAPPSPATPAVRPESSAVVF
ncbi:transglycosylase SLT domain-containing protein [Xanthomonas axonopodis]|uniref:lytic transglycosylase domain-containing protein n=1 Tax=Xanthomonas axonopodis TaxID=53413 RepID=UPI003556AD22